MLKNKSIKDRLVPIIADEARTFGMEGLFRQIGIYSPNGQQEYVFPAQVARVMGNEVGLKLMPLTTQQHIDFVQCTFARADT